MGESTFCIQFLPLRHNFERQGIIFDNLAGMENTITIRHAAVSVSKAFFRFAAIATIGTALTTIVVHAVPNLFAEYDTFLERVELRNNPIYITRFWLVLLHCALVVTSMYAIGIRKLRAAPVLIPLGFLSFVLFAFTEWFRTAIGIFALNRTWRNAYAVTSEETVRQFTENYIHAFSGFNDALFFIFYTAFLAGCVCYGFAYKNGTGSERKIAWLFLIWSATGIPSWLDEIFQTNLAWYVSWMGWYYQCVARAILGIWLWKTADRFELFS
jgi:hypothetical protein